MDVDREKDRVIGFARTLKHCADSGNQVLIDCAFENLVTAVNSYIATCQFNEHVQNLNTLHNHDGNHNPDV